MQNIVEKSTCSGRAIDPKTDIARPKSGPIIKRLQSGHQNLEARCRAGQVASRDWTVRARTLSALVAGRAVTPCLLTWPRSSSSVAVSHKVLHNVSERSNYYVVVEVAALPACVCLASAGGMRRYLASQASASASYV